MDLATIITLQFATNCKSFNPDKNWAMRSFELNIFINRPQSEVHDHSVGPINMIGLQPLMTTIDTEGAKEYQWRSAHKLESSA